MREIEIGYIRLLETAEFEEDWAPYVGDDLYEEISFCEEANWAYEAGSMWVEEPDFEDAEIRFNVLYNMATDFMREKMKKELERA